MAAEIERTKWMQPRSSLIGVGKNEQFLVIGNALAPHSVVGL